MGASGWRPHGTFPSAASAYTPRVLTRGENVAWVEATTDGVEWVPLASEITTDIVQPAGDNRITGYSTWCSARFDLSRFAGQSVQVRLRCEGGRPPRKLLIDDIEIGGLNGVVFSDGAETLDPRWTVSGWLRTTQ